MPPLRHQQRFARFDDVADLRSQVDRLTQQLAKLQRPPQQPHHYESDSDMEETNYDLLCPIYDESDSDMEETNYDLLCPFYDEYPEEYEEIAMYPIVVQPSIFHGISTTISKEEEDSRQVETLLDISKDTMSEDESEVKGTELVYTIESDFPEKKLGVKLEKNKESLKETNTAKVSVMSSEDARISTEKGKSLGERGLNEEFLLFISYDRFPWRPDNTILPLIL